MASATYVSSPNEAAVQEAEIRASVQALDPRVRIVAVITFAMIVVCSRQFTTLSTGLLLAILLAITARLPLGETLKRLLAVDLFIIALLLMLPFTVPGNSLWQFGPMHATREGLEMALAIALKFNAVTLMLLTLVGTLDTVTLGHALHHLRVPAKLVHLLLFTVRYIAVLHAEYRRLRAAMTTRAFRPRSNWHTWSSIGYLFGMLLVRSLERSERILAAMKCRGFHGHYYLLDHFVMTRRDGWFSLAFGAGLLILLSLEWQ